MLQILCLIPARSGSKGIPDKNIKLFANQPLLSWSIIQAQQSKYANQMRIMVSTDSEEYQKIALQYGAEVPFLRPKEISEDHSTDMEFIKHALIELKLTDYEPDIILQLRPTYPFRKVSILDECLEIFIKNRNEYDSLRTIVPFSKSPYKMYTMSNNLLKPLFRDIEIQGKLVPEPYNECRQYLPETYLHNGYIDILNSSLLQNNLISGNNIYGYLMSEEEIHDIDTMEDWNKCEKLI